MYGRKYQSAKPRNKMLGFKFILKPLLKMEKLSIPLLEQIDKSGTVMCCLESFIDEIRKNR